MKPRWGLVAVAAALALTAGCGYNPDMAQIESKLDKQLLQRDLFFTADCPSSVDWKPGSDFHCDLVTVGGGRGNGRITVSMENDKGEFTWVRDSTS